jgi:hypothetical protein
VAGTGVGTGVNVDVIDTGSTVGVNVASAFILDSAPQAEIRRAVMSKK